MEDKGCLVRFVIQAQVSAISSNKSHLFFLARERGLGTPSLREIYFLYKGNFVTFTKGNLWPAFRQKRRGQSSSCVCFFQLPT